MIFGEPGDEVFQSGPEVAIGGLVLVVGKSVDGLSIVIEDARVTARGQ